MPLRHGELLVLPHPDEAEDHFGALASWVANNGPASSEWTRRTLGWTPVQVGIVEDIEQADYTAS